MYYRQRTISLSSWAYWPPQSASPQILSSHEQNPWKVSAKEICNHYQGMSDLTTIKGSLICILYFLLYKMLFFPKISLRNFHCIFQAEGKIFHRPIVASELFKPLCITSWQSCPSKGKDIWWRGLLAPRDLKIQPRKWLMLPQESLHREPQAHKETK